MCLAPDLPKGFLSLLPFFNPDKFAHLLNSPLKQQQEGTAHLFSFSKGYVGSTAEILKQSHFLLKVCQGYSIVWKNTVFFLRVQVRDAERRDGSSRRQRAGCSGKTSGSQTLLW